MSEEARKNINLAALSPLKRSELIEILKSQSVVLSQYFVPHRSLTKNIFPKLSASISSFSPGRQN